MGGFRIKVSDEKLFPVQAFFNAISDADFVDTLDRLSRRIGAGFNAAVCSFPEDLDLGDTAFSGVRFSVLDDEVVISAKALSRFASEAAREYLVIYPDDRIRLKEILDRIDGES